MSLNFRYQAGGRSRSRINLQAYAFKFVIDHSVVSNLRGFFL